MKISSEIVRYGLECSEKWEISRDDGKQLKSESCSNGLPGVEHVPTPRESILKLPRTSQLPYTENIKTMYNKLYFIKQKRYCSIGAGSPL